MLITTGKVRRGTIEVGAEEARGATVTVLVSEDDETFDLKPEFSTRSSALAR